MPTPSGHWVNNIILTDNNPNNDFKSVRRPYEIEKFKLDRKIFSSGKRKSELTRDSNA